jgi:hypothetical protein
MSRRIVGGLFPTNPRVNWGDAINSGLIAWWLGHEGAGEDMADITRQGSDLWANGALGADNWDGRDGFGNRAVRLNYPTENSGECWAGGVSTYYDPRLELTGSEFTISAWINPESWGDDSRGRIIDHVGGSALGKGWAFELFNPSSEASLRLEWSDGTTRQADADTGCISLDTLQHVAVVFVDDGTDCTATFYVNGVEVGSETVTTSSAPATATGQYITVGRRANSGINEFQGIINNIRVLDRVLTPGEISQLYTEPLAGLYGTTTHPFFFFDDLAPGLIRRRRSWPGPAPAGHSIGVNRASDLTRGLVFLSRFGTETEVGCKDLVTGKEMGGTPVWTVEQSPWGPASVFDGTIASRGDFGTYDPNNEPASFACLLKVPTSGLEGRIFGISDSFECWLTDTDETAFYFESQLYMASSYPGTLRVGDGEDLAHEGDWLLCLASSRLAGSELGEGWALNVSTGQQAYSTHATLANDNTSSGTLYIGGRTAAYLDSSVVWMALWKDRHLTQADWELFAADPMVLFDYPAKYWNIPLQGQVTAEEEADALIAGGVGSVVIIGKASSLIADLISGGHFQFYNSGLKAVIDSTTNLETDAVAVALLTSGYTPSGAHSTWADVSANNAATYTQQVLGSKVVTEASGTVYWDAADINFGASVTTSAKYVVMVQGTAGALTGTDPLIGYAQLKSGGGSVTPVAAPLLVRLATVGISEAV